MSPAPLWGLRVPLLLVALLRGPQGAGAETVTAVRVRGGGCFSPHANRIEVGALTPLPLPLQPPIPTPPPILDVPTAELAIIAVLGVGPGRGGR